MRVIVLTILAYATISFAGSVDTVKAPAPIPDKKVIVTGTLPKAPTNWSRIKDLFL